jgi:N-dimethylarginine dimethylaminohydrolase
MLMTAPRSYLMCEPAHFRVEYAINPWMDPETPVDSELAAKQWHQLRQTLCDLGHTVHLLDPEPDLPDMVYAANGALVIDGTAYGARFRYPERAAEADAHRRWYERNGWRFAAPTATNEGEGDFAHVGGMVLAGYGFRTDPDAHQEVQEIFGRPVISLRLVDPRFYHLDTALAVLDPAGRGRIAYYPGAFSPSSQAVLARLFPDAVIADEVDAAAFGLNLVSDSRHVVLNSDAVAMAGKVADAGFTPVPVDLSELRKGGGSVKCCIAELRHAQN